MKNKQKYSTDTNHGEKNLKMKSIKVRNIEMYECIRFYLTVEQLELKKWKEITGNSWGA